MNIKGALKYLEDKNENGQFDEAIQELKKSIPMKVIAREWTHTECPNCSCELSTHHGDGYFSVKKRERCPSCYQRLRWCYEKI